MEYVSVLIWPGHPSVFWNEGMSGNEEVPYQNISSNTIELNWIELVPFIEFGSLPT